MLVEEFKSKVAGARVRPKGVKVGNHMWKELKKAGLIKMKNVALSGILDLGLSLPYYDEDIYVICDPEFELSGKNYELPPNSVTSPLLP